MKIIKLLTGVLVVLFSSFAFTACSDKDEPSLFSEWKNVLDNHGCNYDYDETGRCFGDGGGIGEDNFKKMFIGHGWKNYGTWEIGENGKRLSDEYYSNMYGISPTYYYFDNETQLTTYYRSDAQSAVKKNIQTYIFNNRYNDTPRTVLLLNTDSYIQITGWMLGSQPSFCMVCPLGVRGDKSVIYGVSIYVQMTDKELSDLQNSFK